MGFVPGAINLPLSTLRKRLSEVPEGKKVYVYCQVMTGGPRTPPTTHVIRCLLAAAPASLPVPAIQSTRRQVTAPCPNVAAW